LVMRSCSHYKRDKIVDTFAYEVVLGNCKGTWVIIFDMDAVGKAQK
jgi:hypothetical protein